MDKGSKIRKSINHLIGNKFNKWTLLEDLGLVNGLRMVAAVCECGNKNNIALGSLKGGKSKSCGCSSKRKESEFMNVSFNRIKVIENLGVFNRRTTVKGVCECGFVKSYVLKNLISGRVKSCGCLLIDHNKTHGLYSHKLYKVWGSIKARCYNQSATQYKDYGGRGVTMCDKWKNDFQAFFNWCISNGWEVGMQVDKDIIPRKKGIPSVLYSPEMCSIVTRKKNNRNTSYNVFIEYKGESMTIVEWSEKLGMKSGTLSARLGRLKWTIEKSLSTPIKHTLALCL